MTSTDPLVRRAMPMVTGIGLGLAILALWLTNDPTEIKYLCLALLAIVLAVCWLIACVAQVQPAPALSLLSGLLMAFLAWNAVSMGMSQHPGNSVYAWGRWAIAGLLMLLTARGCAHERDAWRILGAIVIATAISSVYGFCQRLGWDPFPWATRDVLEYRGIPATFGNPNIATHVLNLTLIMGCGLVFRKKLALVWRIFWAIPLALIAVHVSLTEVRAARVALVAAFGLMLLTHKLRPRIANPLRAASAILLIACVAGGAAISGGLLYHQQKTGYWAPLDSSLLHRYHSYYGACRMALDKPVLGFGPGNYAFENPAYWTPYEQERFANVFFLNKNVHNDYFEAAAESGFPGCALYLGLLITGLMRALVLALKPGSDSRRTLGLMLAAALTVFAVDGIFGFPGHTPIAAAIAFILLGILEGITARTKEDVDSQSSRGLLSGVAMLVMALVLTAFEASSFASQVWLQKARGAQEQGYLPEASALLEQGQRLSPWNYQFPAALGGVRMEQKNPGAAVEQLDRCLALYPNFVNGWIALAEACWDESERVPEEQKARWWNRCAAASQQALALCPVLPEGHQWQAQVLAAQAELATDDEAVTLWRETLTAAQAGLRGLKADRGALKVLAARAYAALDDQNAAADAYRQAVQASPERDEIWASFARWSEAKSDRLPVLVDALSTAFGREEMRTPCRPVIAASLARRLADRYRDRMGNPELARAVMARAIKIAPAELDTWGGFFLNLPADGKRLIQLTRALQETQTSFASTNQKFPESLELIQKLVEAKPEEAIERVCNITAFARTLLSKNEPDRFARTYGWTALLIKTKASEPGMPPAIQGALLREAASIEMMSEDWAGAAETLRAAIPLMDGNGASEAQLARADALTRLGDFFEAEACLNAVLAKEPRRFDALWQRARLHVKAGLRIQAQKEYAELLSTFKMDAAQRKQLEAESAALSASAQAAQEPVS